MQSTCVGVYIEFRGQVCQRQWLSLILFLVTKRVVLGDCEWSELVEFLHPVDGTGSIDHEVVTRPPTLDPKTILLSYQNLALHKLVDH
jgi:hypothetical protein